MNATSVTVRHRNLFLTQVYLLSLSPGQHDCVTVINNFFSRAKLEYYTKRQGLEKEPKLPPKLAGPLHKIIMSTNLNPVKVNTTTAVFGPQYGIVGWSEILSEAYLIKAMCTPDHSDQQGYQAGKKVSRPFPTKDKSVGEL
jgi:hypothetical protein